MIPLAFTDPFGDDYGLGYTYPRAALFAEAGFADLTDFEVLQEGEQLILRVRLSRYANPNNAPNGFSLATVALYVDSEPGGSQTLPGAGFQVPEEAGWDTAFLITGWKAEQRQPDGQSQEVTVQLKDDWLELRPSLKPGDYGYYLTTGSYDAFTPPWHFRPTRPGGGSWLIDAPTQSPKALDVLSEDQAAAYQSGLLTPFKAQKTPFPWSIPLAVAGVLTILLAFWFPRR